ncbi:Nucleotide-binding universal stress protein, UspA family [Variovorax sp. OK605]|uniref:universal stress protein n=1 Tax=Variovorax sp. OK605 TaxID=1855317 RepID=UPI0008E2BA38|nr:universal stress protein [Variovorax sp. OK605]SFQ59826.1 Nucleotide-binding universal stress protein, UspA family [Variovorax sp. OK605]
MQSPKSILLHLDSSPRSTQRLKLARRMAEAFDAEVTVLPCTLTSLMRYPFALEGAAQAVTIMQALDKDARDKMHAAFLEQSLGSRRMRWMEPMADAPWSFARQGLYADLMIMGQRDRDDPYDAELPGDFLTSVLVESGRPALVLPYAGQFGQIGRTVLVAWKETRESARAVTASLPWLRAAARVHLVSYGEGAQPALEGLRDYLRAHGSPEPTLHADDRQEGDVAGRLLSLACDLGADLMVMGCYGHSRAREWVLGGATQSMLASMTLPVLMSH